MNSAKTIEQTVQSVLYQSYSDIEYIIIDGKSTDGTLDLIKKYQDKIAFWISEPDSGIYNAMNKALQHATGEIIGILNSDDWYEPNTIEMVATAFGNEKCGIVYGDVNVIDQTGDREVVCPKSIRCVHFGMPVCHNAMFVSKSVYEKIGLYNEKYRIAADYDFLLQCAMNGIQMKYINKTLTNYRNSGVSSTDYESAIRETREIALHYSLNEDMSEEIGRYFDICTRGGKNKAILKEMLYKEIEADDKLQKDIQKYFEEKENIMIFSAGKVGRLLKRVFDHYNIKVYGYLDNNEKKIGERQLECEIFSPEILKKKSFFIIIANLFHEEDIEEQLKENGYVKNINYTTVSDFLETIKIAI